MELTSQGNHQTKENYNEKVPSYSVNLRHLHTFIEPKLLYVAETLEMIEIKWIRRHQRKRKIFKMIHDPKIIDGEV